MTAPISKGHFHGMIRVLIVDDQELVRSGFRIILESEDDIEVVGESADGSEAVQAAHALKPDVICMDVEMPGMNGIEASRHILKQEYDSGAPAILILTTFGHDHYLFDALAVGVSGFLLKNSRAEQLIDAVRTLAQGQALLGPDVTRAVMARAASSANATVTAVTEPGSLTDTPKHSEPSLTQAMDRAGLTDREREVLTMVAQGRSNSEIAEALFLGSATIKTHVSNLLQKVGVRDRIQLVVWVHRQGS